MTEVKWIKLSTDMFADEKVQLIESMPDADTVLVIWFKLLALAGRTNASGYLLLNQSIPYTEDMLVTIFGRNINVIRYALQTFQQFGMIEFDHQNTIYISNWEKHQNIDGLEKIREQNRLRKQKQRDRMRLEVTRDTLELEQPVQKEAQNEVQLVQKSEQKVQHEAQKTAGEKWETAPDQHPEAKRGAPCHVTGHGKSHTSHATEEEKEKELYIAQAQRAPGAQSEKEFTEFWDIYPKRKDRKAAFEKFKTTRKRHELETILKGTRGYAAECKRENREQKYIKHAKTFLNQESFLDYTTQEEEKPVQLMKNIGEDKPEERETWRNTNASSTKKPSGSGLL